MIKLKVRCPECKGTNINQYRMMTGKIWCNHCGFSAPHKEKDNPFLVKEDKKDPIVECTNKYEMKSLKIKQFFEIRSGDVDEWVEEYFGREFEFNCDQEVSNDSSKNYSIRIERHSSYSQKEIEEWIETGKGNWMARALMQEMVNNKFIPAGNYLIDCSW